MLSSGSIDCLTPMADDPCVAVPESVWKPTVKCAKILAQLAAKEHCSKEQIDEAEKKLKIGRAPWCTVSWRRS